MNKQKYGIIIAVIGIFAAGIGGSFALDLSNTQTTNTNTSTDNSQTTIINEGDTIINEIVGDLIEEAYDFYCEEVEPDSEECDWYWEDFD